VVSNSLRLRGFKALASNRVEARAAADHRAAGSRPAGDSLAGSIH